MWTIYWSKQHFSLPGSLADRTTNSAYIFMDKRTLHILSHEKIYITRHMHRRILTQPYKDTHMSISGRWRAIEEVVGESYWSQVLCMQANSPTWWAWEVSSQGSSKFAAKWWGNRSGTRSSILDKVIFIWRLNLATASPTAAVHSSRIMDIVSRKLQQKHYAQLLKRSLWDMTLFFFQVPVFQLLVQLWLNWLTNKT